MTWPVTADRFRVFQIPLRVVTTASRYATLAHGGIVLGDLTDAPELP